MLYDGSKGRASNVVSDELRTLQKKNTTFNRLENSISTPVDQLIGQCVGKKRFSQNNKARQAQCATSTHNETSLPPSLPLPSPSPFSLLSFSLHPSLHSFTPSPLFPSFLPFPFLPFLPLRFSFTFPCHARVLAASFSFVFNLLPPPSVTVRVTPTRNVDGSATIAEQTDVTDSDIVIEGCCWESRRVTRGAIEANQENRHQTREPVNKRIVCLVVPCGTSTTDVS